jgi:hypothetical protein
VVARCEKTGPGRAVAVRNGGKTTGKPGKKPQNIWKNYEKTMEKPWKTHEI